MSNSKVFGIGFSKTGTTSLEKVLFILGYKMYKAIWHNYNVPWLQAMYVHKNYDEIMKITQYYDAFFDTPWGGTELYKILVKKYLIVYYILTLRDPESWYDSFERNFTIHDKNLETVFDSHHKTGRYGSIYIFKHIFKIETLINNKQKIIDYYNKHNQEIIDFFANSKYNFLQMNLIEGDSWEKLCPFLQKEIPFDSFPHKNIGKENEKMLYGKNLVNEKYVKNDKQFSRKKIIKSIIPKKVRKLIQKINDSK